MKKVLLEMEKLRNPNSGLGQFCFHLGRELAALAPDDLRFQFYLPEKRKGLFGEQVDYIPYSQLHKFIPAAQGMDIWHCTHQGSKYLPRSKRTKLVLTIHDLNFLDKYTGIKRKLHLDALQRKVRKAAAITFISRFTERVARENLELPEVPSRVIYNGNSLQVFEHAPRPWFAPTGRFLFTIGIISPKKNFHTLLPLIRELKDVSLVIAGNDSGAYARDILERARQEGVSSRVIMPGQISEEEKYWCYQNCEAFVFPSLSEGFGLPVVEAMSCGRPVFLSSSSSLPEIGGQAAFYWKNFNAGEMKTVFENGMKAFGSGDQSREQAARFSWKKAAKEYTELYRSL